jgi:hypothetical protein
MPLLFIAHPLTEKLGESAPDALRFVHESPTFQGVFGHKGSLFCTIDIFLR